MDFIVYLAFGARDGDPERHLREGIASLRRSGLVLQSASGLWETEPVGIPGSTPVLNAAIEASTRLAPHGLLAACRAAEDEAGRRRGAPEWRSLDVDILLYDRVVMDEAELTLPHPRFHRRRFNLEPLAEIAPAMLHPLLGVRIDALLASCDDISWARRVGSTAWTGGSDSIVETPRGLH